MLSGFCQDVRFALRGWRRRPGFTAALIGMLGLGLAATITLFAVAYAVLWQPWPVAHPDSIIAMEAWTGGTDFGLDAEQYRKLARAPGFGSFGAWLGYSEMQMGERGGQPQVEVSRMTPSLLPLLGLQPELGRNFSPSAIGGGRGGVAMLSDTFWRSRFGGDRHIVGRRLTLDNRIYTVIGVGPPAASQVLEAVGDVWLPLIASPGALGAGGDWQVLARLRPGVTWKQEAPVLAAFAKSLDLRQSGFAVRISGQTLADSLAPDAASRNGLLVLLGAVGLVLLIACMNVAGLLLARGLEREPEMAVRRALGTTRARLVRQVLSEGALLAVAALGLGLLLSRWGVALMRKAPLSLDRLGDARLQPAVMGFAVAAVAVCIAVSSLGPALRLSASGGSRRQSARGAFVVAEVALALVLLVGAVLLATSFARLLHVDTGLDGAHLAAAEFYPPLPLLAQMPPQQRVAAVDAAALRVQLAARRMLARARAVPGWRATVAASPPYHAFMAIMVHVPGAGSHAGPHSFEMHAIMPDYFATMGQRLLSGRDISAADSAAAPGVVVVNAAWARVYSPGRSPLGLVLREPRLQGAANLTVVGVVSDARDILPRLAPRPELYLSFAQAKLPTAALLVRTTRPAAAVAAMRTIVQQAAPDMTLRDAEPVLNYTRVWRALPQFRSLFLGAFAALALVFALAGIWAQVAFSVEQRRREFGIRLALGAQGSQLLRAAMVRIAVLTGIGMGVGIAAALALTRVMGAMLFNLSPTDPATFAIAAAGFALVAVAAAWLPARRVLRLDPAETLRCE